MIGGLGTALRFSGLALVLAGGFGCRVAVRSGLSETDANQIVVALDRAAIGAGKRIESGVERTYLVEVPAAEEGRALRLLAAQALPTRLQPGLEALYAEPSLLPTPSEERARWLAASAGELARSLQRMPGVVDARVHLSPPHPVVALDAAPEATRVALLIERRAGRVALDEAPIRTLVLGALPGLAERDLTIVQVAVESEQVGSSELVAIGPFRASRASAPALRMVLCAGLGLHLVLALALVVLVRRQRSEST